MSKMIPLSVPNFEGNEELYTTQAVKEGWVSTGGAFIDRLEQDLEKFIHAPVAACQSGTAALHLALIECKAGPGTHVIVPSLTFIAAVNPVRYQFAEPIFMDCDDSLCMDAGKLRSFCETECIQSGEGLIYKKTGYPVRAVVVVHVFGNMADMESIMETAGKYGLRIIEDATEALGTSYTTGKYKGRMAGTIGDFGAYSFNGNKIITTGGGGAITAADKKELAHLKYLSTQAKDDALCYIHHEVGYNYRMTNLQAALGVAQLELLEEFIRRKNRNYDFYRECLKECPNGSLLTFSENINSNKWFYSFVIRNEKPDLRKIIAFLSEKGIQTRPVWGLIHEQKPYKKSPAYKIEKAFYYSRHIINIPCSTNLQKEEILCVAEALNTLPEGVMQ